MAQIVSDAFTRADGALGANWTAAAALAFAVVSNACGDNGSSGSDGSTFTGASWTGGADQYAEATIKSQGTVSDSGPMARSTATGATASWNCYAISVNDTDSVALGSSMTCVIYKCATGTFTALGGASGSFTISANDVLRIEAQGTTMRFKQNGTTRLTGTDGSIASGQPGLRAFCGNSSIAGSNATYDDFAAGDFSGGSPAPHGGFHPGKQPGKTFNARFLKRRGAYTSGANNYTLLLDVGSYVYTGSSAGLIAARKLQTGVGTYVYTGQVSSPIRGRYLSVNPGSYVYTGVSESNTRGRYLLASPGTYVLTGASAILKADRKLLAATGAYIYTGASAGLIAARKLNAATGSYVYTGASAVLKAARILAASPGAYSYTGASAALTRGRVLNVSPGSYVLTGSSAVLQAAHNISLSPGVYTLTGAAALLVRTTAGAFTLDASPGSYVYTGVGTKADIGNLSAFPSGGGTTFLIIND